MNLSIKPNHELRFEAGESIVKIKVISGHCEIKGEELLLNKFYEFENTKSFVFAHTESQILLEGECSAHYITENTNVLQILRFLRICLRQDSPPNFKHATENIQQSLQRGRFIVLGQGKATFLQTIANYFIRIGKRVLITEISPKTGFLAFPGVLGSCLCTKLFNCQIEGPTDLPLVYYYGSTSLTYNIEYYKDILQNIDQLVQEKEFDFHFVLATEETLSYISEYIGLQGTFVVLKDEKLYNKLQGDRIFISNGAYEAKMQNNNFFTSKNHTLYNIKLWSKIVRIGEEFLAPEGALPIGAERKVGTNIITDACPRKNMILAVSYAEKEEDIKNNPVKSFVVVNEVGNGFVKVQSPQPSLKANFLVQGEIFL